VRDTDTNWLAKNHSLWLRDRIRERQETTETEADKRLDAALAPFLLAPPPQLRAVHAEVEPVAHAQDETGSIATEGDAASGAAARERARLEDGIAGAAGHGEDEHGGRVA
jgi:hypothetical protein